MKDVIEECKDCTDEIKKENYRYCTNPDCGERYLNLKRKCDICEWKAVKNLNDTNGSDIWGLLGHLGPGLNTTKITILQKTVIFKVLNKI